MFPNNGVSDDDESKVVQLNNGSFLVDIRTVQYRWFTISNDNGYSCGTFCSQYEILDQRCNGEIIHHTSTLDGFNKDCLIRTNLHSQNGRKKLTITIIYNEGKIRKYRKIIELSYSMYYSVAISPIDEKFMFIGKNGSILILNLVVKWYYQF